jgi:hypothetical protein
MDGRWQNPPRSFTAEGHSSLSYLTLTRFGSFLCWTSNLHPPVIDGSVRANDFAGTWPAWEYNADRSNRNQCCMTTTADRDNSSVVSLFPCPEDVERDDFISSGEGERLRTFRNSVAVRAGLRQAAIPTDMIEDAIDALDDGVPLPCPCDGRAVLHLLFNCSRLMEGKEYGKRTADCASSLLSRPGRFAPFAPPEGRPC